MSIRHAVPGVLALLASICLSLTNCLQHSTAGSCTAQIQLEFCHNCLNPQLSVCHSLQDLVMWMKKHNPLLRGPEGSVREAFAELCGGIEDEQAAAQTLPGYGTQAACKLECISNVRH